jgi:predicted porin
MRKTQVALAALALMASTAALADGVKVYGTADASIVNDKTGTFFAGAGNNAGSIFGFTGTEDMGGGLKASFTLETGVSYGDGQLVNGGYGGAGYAGLFNRQANLAIGNDAVTVKLGQQISTFVDASLTGIAGVTGNAGFVPALNAVAGGLGGTATSTVGGANTNAFFYADLATVSVNLGGATVTAQTQIGGKTAAGVNKGSYTAGSITGNVAGINLAAAMFSEELSTGMKGSVYTVGGNTQVAGLTLRGSYGSGSSDTHDGSGYALGIDYPINDAMAVGYTYAKSSWNNTVAMGNTRSDDTPGSQNTIGLKYSMSKQTFAYVTYSNFSADTATSANQTGGGVVKSVSMIGLAHSF